MTERRYLVGRTGRLSAFLTAAVGRRPLSFDREYRNWILDSVRLEVVVDAGLSGTALRAGASIWDLLDCAEPARVVVLGTPGSGKSTLLRQVARHTATTARERRRPTPVLLRLREHVGDLARDPGLTLPALLRRSIPALPAAEPDGWWEASLHRGDCVVLLDGLGETGLGETGLGDTGLGETRPDVTRWVNAQISAYPRNDYVMTSRRDRHGVAGLVATVQVLPFTVGQVREFLHGWHAAAERRSPALDGATPDGHGAADLFDRLVGSPALDDLTGNPLLLSMIAEVHRVRGALPASRADLCGEVCRMMLDRGHRDPRGAGRELLLAPAAFRMMRDRRRRMSSEELFGSIEPARSAAAGPDVSRDGSRDGFLDGFMAGGLLVEPEREVYEFAHPALRDYLAARHIRAQRLDEVLVEAVDDPWWREVTLLRCAGTDAGAGIATGRVVRAGLASGTPAALSLAFACAAAAAAAAAGAGAGAGAAAGAAAGAGAGAGAGLAPDLRDRLDHVLHEAFDADGSADRRRLCAAVLAGRHLARLVATRSGTRICPDPVVTGLYSLFLADTGVPRPDGPCPAGPAETTVVTGAWSRDAVRFVAWLNEATGGGSDRYRLPTHDELDQLADGGGVAVQILSSVAGRTWTREPGGRTRLWTSAGASGSSAVPIRRIHDHAANEMRRSTVLRTMLTRTVTESCRDLRTALEPIAGRSARLADLLQATRSGGTGGDRNSDVRSARGTAQDIGNELLRARKSAVRLERALRNSASLDPAVATAVVAALGGLSIGRIVDDLARASGLEWYVAIELDWNSDFGLAPATRTARDVAASADRARREVKRLSAAPHRPVAAPSIVDRVLGLDAAADREPHSGPGPDAGISLDATGSALRNAIHAMLRPAARGDDPEPIDRFTQALVREAFREYGHDVVAVDLERVADGAGRLAHAPLRRFPAPRWTGGVVARIAAAAEPVLSRTRELTPGRAAAIRIPCLVMAAEANLCGQPELGARFRELAAAVTLVEMRRQNPDLLETILVAYA